MYARWYVATSAIPTQGVGHLLLEWQQTGNSNRLPVSDGENASLAGGNASTLPQGELADGQSIWGFQLCLKSDGWGSRGAVPRLFPGGPTVEFMIPRYDAPSKPILACKQFGKSEPGSMGLRDFHLVTQPGGRTATCEGYYHALLMGMYPVPEDAVSHGRCRATSTIVDPRQDARRSLGEATGPSARGWRMAGGRSGNDGQTG